MSPRILTTIRVICFIIVYVTMAVLIGMLITFLPANVVMGLFPLLSMIMPIVVVVCFRVFWDRKSVGSLGFLPLPTWLAEFSSGAAVGTILITLIFITGVAGGWISFKSHFGAAVMSWQLPLILLTFFFWMLLLAFSEELVFRGYIYRNILEGWGTVTAVVVSALLFSLGHVFNPGFSPYVAFNLFLSGIVLAGGVVATKRLWWPIGLHLTWNYFQGYIFGFPVSGLTNTGSVSLFITKVNAPAWLFGGSFGPEGGVVTTAAFAAALVFLWVVYGRRKDRDDAGAA